MDGGQLMRPKSMVLFERLYLAAIAIEIGRVAIEWPLLLQSSASEQWVRVVSVLVSLLLVLLTARRRSRVAGLILAALFAIGLPMVATVFRSGVGLATSAAIVAQLALQAAALAQLFRPASRAWFDGKDETLTA